MQQRRIPNTDLYVSVVCLGTMTFGTPVDQQGVNGIIDWCLDNGLNFIDTADMYEGYTRFLGSPGGKSEAYIGNALQGRRDRAVSHHEGRQPRRRRLVQRNRVSDAITSSTRSTPASAGSVPTTSTSTRCTAMIPTRRWQSRLPRWPDSLKLARSATGDSRTSNPTTFTG